MIGTIKHSHKFKNLEWRTLITNLKRNNLITSWEKENTFLTTATAIGTVSRETVF